MPKSAKKKGQGITFYKAPHKPEESTVKHHYTMFSADISGILTETSSTLKLKKVTWPSPGETQQSQAADKTPNINPSSVLSDELPDDPAYIQHLEDTASIDERTKRFRAKGDESLRDFVPLVDLYLEELITLEGRGGCGTDICGRCGSPGTGVYQCDECWGREMFCMGCMVNAHRGLYLHRIKKWNSEYFEKTSLKSLGLRVQLGHSSGEPCPNPVHCSSDDFIILHTNGMHEVGLDFCGCGQDNQLHIVQLLRSRLFPATVVNPKTAATTEALDLFSILSYESKISAFQFYHSLSRLTDNTGINAPKDRYPSFLRMIHEWRHLMMLKRAGRGHDPNGVAVTKEGECAVLCPACPQPGKNMPENWKERPEHLQFLDTLFVALDANFRLKRKNVSSHAADPGLSNGYSFFVEETRYREHLKNYMGETEPASCASKSSCSRHDAVNLSETKPGQGHAATGIGAIVCSRHDMKRPGGVAQLQKGERYCNMDYIFFSTLKDTEIETFVISYDIVCQWSINLRARMAGYSPNFFLFNNRCKATFLVPKFHLPAHVAKCRTQFSFNLTKNVGRTEGEAPERGWVGPNALAPSTKEMGPGSCRDTLDVHFGDANHKKMMGLGESLLRKIMAAAKDMAEHVIGHHELESTISRSSLEEWSGTIEAWEADSSQPNPFEPTVSGPTQTAVRRKLAEEEQHRLQGGKDFTLDDEVTPSVLVAMGIDLENEQRSYKEACSKLWDHALDRQHTKLLLRGNTLTRKIEAWAKFQVLYIPAVARLRDDLLRKVGHVVELKAHELPLWLPSQIQHQIAVPDTYLQLEFDLCIPQAREALDDLRSHLQVRAHVFKFKDRFIRGQGANTRARNTLDIIQSKIDRAADEYRVAYKALCFLGPVLRETDWTKDFLVLNKDDVRDLSEGKAKQSEGRRDISWIWRTVAVDRIDKPQEGHYREGVRIEWAKSRARASRFTEEVSLLTEEMSRVERFFIWKANDWASKADTALFARQMSPMRIEGFIAYAMRQADVPAHVARMESVIQDPSLALPDEFDTAIRAKDL